MLTAIAITTVSTALTALLTSMMPQHMIKWAASQPSKEVLLPEPKRRLLPMSSLLLKGVEAEEVVVEVAEEVAEVAEEVAVDGQGKRKEIKK